jgi:5-methyltetrahydropteroyltriglutamate--homocysteine methyltransferase
MYKQFLKPMADYEIEPNLINVEKAFIPEMFAIEKFAKEHYERVQKQLKVKICVTGPIELYIRKIDFTVYLDMAYNFAKSVNAFIKNSLYNTKYLKTAIVSIDEPSFGYVDVVNVNDDDIIGIFDKCLEGVDVTSQIHLHTLNRATIPLQTKNMDVLTCEYASDNSNVISKKDLDQYDKFMRVGITRTNINSLMAEALDSGVSQEDVKSFEGTMNLIDPKERIEKNLIDALKHYRDRLRFVGPDCGLSGWYPPQVAYELLHRTYEVIEKVKKSS